MPVLGGGRGSPLESVMLCDIFGPPVDSVLFVFGFFSAIISMPRSFPYKLVKFKTPPTDDIEVLSLIEFVDFGAVTFFC